MILFVCILLLTFLLCSPPMLIVMIPQTHKEQQLEDEAQLAFLREYRKKHPNSAVS